MIRATTATEAEVATGTLHVWHIPQVPGEAFRVEVSTPEEGKQVIDLLAQYDLFQFEHRIKPDYANASGMEVSPAEGGWEEWESTNGESVDDIDLALDAVREMPDPRDDLLDQIADLIREKQYIGWSDQVAHWHDRYKVDLPAGKHGEVEIRPIVIDESLAKFSNMRAVFQGGRGRVEVGTYTGLYRNGGLWMSDTPDEINDHLPMIWRAGRVGGRVLVNGLGLGMVVKALLAMENVEHVDVVEIDPDVVALVGPAYVGDRCTVHLADAHEIQWPKGTRWSAAWHDIWQDISTDNAESMTRLKRKYGRRVDWQACWAQPEITRLKREERGWQW